MAKSIDEPTSNKVNVYLIKEGHVETDHVINIDTDKSIRWKTIKGVGVLYYKKSQPYTPDWVTKFFRDTLKDETKEFKVSSSQAVLIVKIDLQKKIRLFAIPFGSGRFLLKEGIYVERFGLKVALNTMAIEGIRSLGKRTLTSNPKLSNEQVSKAGGAADFQIDFEKDLVQSITGHTSVNNLGKVVTGKDSLSVSCKTDVSNIVPFLKECLRFYKKNNYKENFDWIDYIQEIKSAVNIENLNAKLLEMIGLCDESVWLATPSIIDWSDFSGFKYSTKKSSPSYEELLIEDFIECHDCKDSLSLDTLTTTSITCWSNSTDDYEYKWKTFNCLNAEVKLHSKNYLLDNGKWYEINKDFVSEVEDSYTKIPWIKLPLPYYLHSNEGDYNKAAATKILGHCLDAKNIVHGGGKSKIEFCDILSKKKELLYVKHYSGSAALSHLFSQGFVSAELLLNDQAFRKKVVALVPKKFQSLFPLNGIKSKDYKLVYVIIAKGKDKISLPFFSKVNLKNFYKRLTNYGYKVSLCHVQNRS